MTTPRPRQWIVGFPVYAIGPQHLHGFAYIASLTIGTASVLPLEDRGLGNTRQTVPVRKARYQLVCPCLCTPRSWGDRGKARLLRGQSDRPVVCGRTIRLEYYNCCQNDQPAGQFFQVEE
jgi:hypothetical protein